MHDNRGLREAAQTVQTQVGERLAREHGESKHQAHEHGQEERPATATGEGQEEHEQVQHQERRNQRQGRHRHGVHTRGEGGRRLTDTRGVQLQLHTARIGKAPTSFTASMHAVSVSSLALIPSFLVLNLLVFFLTLTRSGGGAFFLTMLMGLVLAFAVFSGEALTYLGLNRLGRFAKSPIIMHAALSTAWVFASMIVYYVAIRLMGA